MSIQSVLKSQKNVCEDRCGHTDGVYWVIDGYSGLEGTQTVSEDYGSDGSWYVELAESYIRTHFSNQEKSLQEHTRDMIAHLQSEYPRDVCEEPLVEQPGAQLWVARRTADNFEYLNIGDCSGILLLSTDRVLTIRDTGPRYFDQRNAKQRNPETPLSNRSEKVTELIKSTRRRMNTPDGYRACAFDPDVAYNAITGTIPSSEVQASLLFTDGFESLVDLFGLYSSWESVITQLDSKPLSEFVTELRDAENNDPNATEYPRLKKSDDIGVLYATYQ